MTAHTTHCLAPAAFALIAALSLAACAAPRITGRAVDHETGKPVTRVAIETVPPTDYLVTNHRGAFAIERMLDASQQPQALPEGRYTLRLKKLGYKTRKVDVTIEGRGEIPMGDIELERKEADPGDMTVPVQGTDVNHQIDIHGFSAPKIGD